MYKPFHQSDPYVQVANISSNATHLSIDMSLLFPSNNGILATIQVGIGRNARLNQKTKYFSKFSTFFEERETELLPDFINELFLKQMISLETPMNSDEYFHKFYLGEARFEDFSIKNLLAYNYDQQFLKGIDSAYQFNFQIFLKSNKIIKDFLTN